MSKKTASTVIDVSSALSATPGDLISALEAGWLKTERKRGVPPSSAVAATLLPMPLLTQPVWSRSDIVMTCCDRVPTVVIPGLPCSNYLQFLPALVAYTMADMCVESPHLALERGVGELGLSVTLVVAARAASWAALGRTPDAHETISSSMVRWSSKASALVVSAGVIEPRAALWRHFLATSPAPPDGLKQAAVAMAGLGPMLFLVGGARLTNRGEVYAMHYLERGMKEFAAKKLTRSDYKSLGLREDVAWETLTAAAVGGYSVSVIGHICADPAFITGAQAALEDDQATALKRRLQGLIASSREASQGIAAGRQEVRASRAEKPSARWDDTFSVADTDSVGATTPRDDRTAQYVMSQAAQSRAASPARSVASEMSGPEISPFDVQAIQAAQKMMRQEAQKAPSEAAGGLASEVVQF